MEISQLYSEMSSSSEGYYVDMWIQKVIMWICGYGRLLCGYVDTDVYYVDMWGYVDTYVLT